LKSEKSEAAFARAEKVIPGGVNSPVRAFGSVGGTPRFIERGEGAYLFDVDGNKYLDYVCSWGPLIAGHAHPEVVDAVAQAAQGGTSFGAATEQEIRLAEELVDRIPSVEKARLVNSGTEACMTAVRLARAFTGRPLVVKFDGCYHGHADHFQVRAGSGLATASIPSGAGIPEAVTESTVSLPFNDKAALASFFDKRGGEVACIIVEPVPANMGVILPRGDFLQQLRTFCDDNDALLVFDEVITGFRVARGGVQELAGVMPDLTCMGKVVGGGLPLGAVGGRAEIMDRLAPLGDVYQAGTLSGNPLAVAAGLKTLEILDRDDAYRKLDSLGLYLAKGLAQTMGGKGILGTVSRIGSLLTVFFMQESKQVIDFETAARSDKKTFTMFFQGMLERGIYLPPSPFEAWFVSLAHTEEDLDQTLEAFARVF